MDRTLGANYDNSSGIRLFKDGPPGTTVEQIFLNGIQEELIGAIQATAQTPSISDRTQLMNTIGMMGLGLRNGVIVPSVAGNNLTVAIKTLAGLDPSTTNPVYVRIGDTLRKITSALYVTATGGTDHWDRTSYTFSLFVYLGWSTTSNSVEIALCCQPTYLVYPAANPAAPDPRRLIAASGANTAATLISGNTMQVCGRVDGVVNSAGDNFTAVTSTALSYPIYNTLVLESPEVPTRSNVADTTPVFSTNKIAYRIAYDHVCVMYYFNGDGGADGAGVAGYLGLNLPFDVNSSLSTPIVGGSCFIAIANWDGSNNNTAIHFITTGDNNLQWHSGALVAGTQLTLMRPANFTAGARGLWGELNYLAKT
jgi:hypothetical protein